jgi:putative NIF3 family GTP cyclohydrolase 1 type 2
VLPPTAWGVRAAGEPDRLVATVAVSGGAGDGYLADAAACGADAFLTADLRHHPASEYLAGNGPALLDAAHWATERPWLDAVAAEVAAALPVRTVVSDLDTDPWTLHAPSPLGAESVG